MVNDPDWRAESVATSGRVIEGDGLYVIVSPSGSMNAPVSATRCVWPTPTVTSLRP